MINLGSVRVFMDGKEVKGLGAMEWANGRAGQQIERAKRDASAERVTGIHGELSVTMEWHGKMKDPAMREYWFKKHMDPGSRPHRGMQPKPTKKQRKDKRHGQKI
ncbi:hypothetical protein JD523_20190 [Aeromonas enteropelogenes]|uniref:hypothetical protein n=1 Tax=Aeromonas enteropelogenes TaxID=29489 RepID=UPI00191D3CC9|nr:hypothetical protein [Aeromonas enteropelogenes]MBL0523180.1 hypothetical protein [Aeromonas enteropelogenes]